MSNEGRLQTADMNNEPTEIDALAAPSGDGEVLVWPDPQHIPRLIERNRRLRQGYEFQLAGRPATTLLKLDHSGEPVIMTGHQPAFIHPGVWIKGLAAEQLAAKVGGQARFLAVDTDAVHRLALEWPEEEGGAYQVRRTAPMGSAGDLSYAQLPRRGAAEWSDVFAGPLAACSRWGAGTLSAFAGAFLGDDDPHGGAGVAYMDRWTRGMEATERATALPATRAVRVSDAFAVGRHEGIAAFVGHLILHAAEFAASYNAALAEYREQRGLRGRHHPIPDLAIEDRRTELPLWLVGESGPRRRFIVSTEAHRGVRLWAGTESVGTVGHRELLANPREVLRSVLARRELMPRALTLTMYARLFACELFIHGIGGAKYDQIADGVIRRFFGVEPPAYVCVSGTVRLPLRLREVSEADRAAGQRRIRDRIWNPQRHLDAAAGTRLAGLVEERAEAVAESGRLRREAPGEHAARRTAFSRIHQATRAIVAAVPGPSAGARAELERVERLLADNRVARSREWFFALYPPDQLRRLVAALPFG